MENPKPFDTTISSTCVLESFEDGKSVDENKYRGIIGSLFYLIASWPNVLFSVSKCVKIQSATKEAHLTIVKYIIRYLIGIRSYGLWYPNSTKIILKGFLDANYAGDKVDW